MPKNCTQTMTVMGTVGEIDPAGAAPSFTIRTRGGDVFRANVSEVTYFLTLQNLDRLNRHRLPDPVRSDLTPLGAKLVKYLKPGRLVAAEGVFQASEGREWYDVKTLNLLYSQTETPLFEHTNWW